MIFLVPNINMMQSKNSHQFIYLYNFPGSGGDLGGGWGNENYLGFFLQFAKMFSLGDLFFLFFVLKGN